MWHLGDCSCTLELDQGKDTYSQVWVPKSTYTGATIQAPLAQTQVPRGRHTNDSLVGKHFNTDKRAMMGDKEVNNR